MSRMIRVARLNAIAPPAGGIAVAATAVVHLANNLFKLALVGRHANRPVLLHFGLPATAAAVLGALLLNRAAGLPPLAGYAWGGHPSRSSEMLENESCSAV